MASILDQTLLAPNSSYFFFRQTVSSQPITSFADGGWEENNQIIHVVPKKVEDDNGSVIIPEYTTAEGTLDMNSIRAYALNSGLELDLKNLFGSLLEIDLATSQNNDNVNELIALAYRDVVRKTDMIEFSEEISDEINIDSEQQQFYNEKNKLYTLMLKNKNIKKKLDYSNLIKTVLIFVLILYVLMLSLIYLHGSRTFALTDILNKVVTQDSSYLVLIGISLFVSVIYVSIDLYQIMTNKKILEEFDELSNPTRTDLVSAIIVYLEKLPMVSELREQLREKVSDKRSAAIKAILNDFNNMNYISMRRYQLADYKLNKTRQVINFAIKYGFLLVSSIGLIAGFKLKSDFKLAGNDTSGLIISSGMFMIYTLVSILAYILVLIGINRQNMLRRQYNWNKLYWNTKSTSQNIQN